MRRRDFVSIVCGVSAWPFYARAQQQGRVRHIGMLLGLATGPDDPGTGEILRPLRAAMQESGWGSSDRMEPAV
jgi:hypothetical protein